MPRPAPLAAALLAALSVSLGGVAPAAGASIPGNAAPIADVAARATAPDPSGRWIVLLRDGAAPDTARGRAQALGVKVDRTFRTAVHGYAAKLDAAQLDAVRRDPDVEAVIPDEVVSMEAQSTPRGVRRVFGTRSPIAKIDGTDERVDADVAIVDTGIDPGHRDLNVVGGMNCSNSDTTAWYDQNGHGTHVAGTVGALDNGAGVVGVAPGVRLWSVRILDASGKGLVSWYVCGLDWITAQRDPADPSRPLFEAVNMSVAKSGSDDHDCGLTNADAMHRAVCRLVGSGVTVVAAAGNNSFNAARLIPASYNEVITVSALADTDGLPGGLGGNACYSWGSYDKDDTFADFSNYGRDVDLIAPGKCIWSTVPGNRYAYLSGTSMAAPHVTGAVALYKSSRPAATPVEVRLALQAAGNMGWKTSTDPDAYHEPLLDVSRIVNLGDYAVVVTPPVKPVGIAGATLSVPVDLIRAEDFAGGVALAATAEAPLGATLTPDLLTSADGTRATLTITVPPSTATGTYRVTVTGTSGDLARSTRVAIRVDGDRPTASAPKLGVVVGPRFETTWFESRGSWGAASDATSAITAYQVQWRVDGGSWGASIDRPTTNRTVDRRFVVGHEYALRVRARDLAGNWSAWVTASPFTAKVVQDGSRTLAKTGTWRRSSASVWSGGTTRYAKARGASIGRSFTGRAFAIVAPYGTTRGSVTVWVDGVVAATVNLHRSSLYPRRVVFARSWPTSGTHAFRLVVVGTKDHPRVDLDAVVIVR